MTVDQTAQVYTEMLNDPKYRKLVASGSKQAFRGWDLSKEEQSLLKADAKAKKVAVKKEDSKTMNYLVHRLPLTREVGNALGNAVGRHLGLPVIGPSGAAAGCICCGWTGRLVFGHDPMIKTVTRRPAVTRTVRTVRPRAITRPS